MVAANDFQDSKFFGQPEGRLTLIGALRARVNGPYDQ